MIVAAGREAELDLMEDGGLNVDNVAEFVANGMTVGEFSSPLLKGKNGKFLPGAGDIAAAVRSLRSRMEAASAASRTERGLK
jgi:hypothetical protein